jgi:tripartite-type tricarboxylate transporter receptor subunit TctC
VFGTSGIAGFGHLAAELFQAMSQTEMTHVPYKGGAPAMMDLVGGQVPLLFASMGTAVPYIASGKIKALGVTSSTRASALPSVPTVAEQGLNGYEMSMWFALIGPSKLPVEAVSRLSSALINALAVPAVQTAIKRQGYEPTPSSPEQLRDLIQVDLDKWAKVIRDRKLTFA